MVVGDNKSLAHFNKFHTKHTRSNSNTLYKFEPSIIIVRKLVHVTKVTYNSFLQCYANIMR